MNLIFMGAPGAGKGTQSKLVVDRAGIVQISTGDILRAAVKEGTEMGNKAKEFMDAGKLVPDEVMIGIIEARIQEPDCKNGFILDGFPRTSDQAVALDSILNKHNLKIDHVLQFEVPNEELTERLLKRAEIEGRSDDNIDSIKNRLKVYTEKTQPLIDYYKGKGNLAIIDGTGTIDQISDRVKSTIGV